ncbi:MAG: transposase [Proteobacteria bacterium]|nr:transposase [Pseudomonadota bacterium]MBU4469438.1 transposase [Pseudomonadota bacterium]MCG2752339.1 transposase [Desulfobacteraceae bacterium]
MFESSNLAFMAENHLRTMAFLKKTIKGIEQEVKSQAKVRKEFKILQTIPGIGPMPGMTIMLEVGDIRRFPTAGNYSSYCRCVKSQKISNSKKKGEGNRKNGNKYLSWAYVEAANQMKGRFEVQGKGGKIRDIRVSLETYKALKETIEEKGSFPLDFNDRSYRNDLEKTARFIDEDPENKGSHGLRWNFAQNRFSEVQLKADVNEIQALSIVSEEMGHIRASITEHYLGK